MARKARPSARPSSNVSSSDAKSRVGRPQRRYDLLAVLDAIELYQRSNDSRSPSQRRIQAELTISAASVVHNLVHRLARRDLLTITNHGRGVLADLELTPAGFDALQTWRSQRANLGGA